MTAVALAFVVAPLALAIYCWILYPLIVSCLSSAERAATASLSERDLPRISVVIAAHNAEDSLGRALTALVNDDYPSGLRSILVVSDASHDDTPRIVRTFRRHNVRLLQTPRRVGKTGAENLAARHVCSDIVVCTDAHVQIERGSLRALVRELRRPDVGVVSGTDVAIASDRALGVGERSYIRAEMWLRRKESAWSGLVGASGCLYAMRRSLFTSDLRPSLTRDFGVVLLARRYGWRTVAADGARCRLSASTALRIEYTRKVRTIVQGLETLTYFQDLMSPVRYGRFAFALFSHKLCRWFIPLLTPLAVVGGGYLLAMNPIPPLHWAIAFAAALLVPAIGKRSVVAVSLYALLVQLASLAAWLRFLLGQRIAIWTPTSRASAAVPHSS